MFYVDAINKEETYSLYDVFGRDKVCYKGTISRIHGWETPASIFYVRDKKLRIRFKRVLEPFYNAYQDLPFEGDPDFVFYDKEVEDHIANEGLRRMEYAIRQYKNENHEFAVSALFHEELEEKINNDELFIGPEFSFYNGSAYSFFYDLSCFYFPIDIDAFITDISLDISHSREEAILVYWNGQRIPGHVGYDGKFYCTGIFYGDSDKPLVYSLDNGVEEIATPQWMSNIKGYLGYTFLKGYIVCPDNSCYDYSGEYLEAKTKHHRNVGLLNTVIRRLSKEYPKGTPNTLYLQLVAPREFTEFHISLVETLVVPHLATKGLLNTIAWEHFKNVRSIIENVGLSTDFETAFKNILNLNKYQLYGGSRRNICGERLYENLRKLNKKVGNDRMAFLLDHEIELKVEMAKMNKVKVEEIHVSEEAFYTIKFDRKVPKEFKTNPKWNSMEAGTMVVFSNGTEQFCTITTHTTKGLGINRI